MDPSGKKLGRIVDGQPATTNMAFGGDDWKTLLFTSRSGGRDKDLEVCLEDGNSIDVPVRCAACV